MSIASFAAVGLIEMLLAAEPSLPLHQPSQEQLSPSLVDRDYELLPNARWLEELSQDDARWIESDFSALAGARSGRPLWDVFRRQDIDFALEVKRSLRSYSLGFRAIELSMPPRSTINEDFMFNERDTAWGTMMESLFYALPVFYGLYCAGAPGCR